MAGSSAVRRRAIRGYAEKRAVKLFSQTVHQLKTRSGGRPPPLHGENTLRSAQRPELGTYMPCALVRKRELQGLLKRGAHKMFDDSF